MLLEFRLVRERKGRGLTRSLRSAVYVPVILDYLLSHLGFFAVLPVLPLLLGRLQGDADPFFLGVALFTFTFAVRGGSLFCSRLLHRTPVRRAIAGGLFVAGAGLVILTVVPGRSGILGCLVLSGVGISTNGLMVRAYVAMAVDNTATRNTVFSAIQVAGNVSAAVGPVVANFLVSGERDGLLLLLIAAMYGLAAVVVLATIPAGLNPRDRAVREPLRLGLLRAMVYDPRVRRVSVVAAAGSFLYGQFFSAMALTVAAVSSSPPVRASFFTANAVLVVALQIPVSAWTARGLRSGAPPMRYLLVGVATFAGSFVVLFFGGSAVVGVAVGVAIFSLAETFFTPMVNTAYAGISGDRPVVEAFNMRQVAVTLGESLGAFAGGALFLAAAHRGMEPFYWIALASGGTAVVCAHMALAPSGAQKAREAV